MTSLSFTNVDEALIGLICYALGWLGARWYGRRPRKVVQEDRDAGVQRYQAYKAGKLDG